MRDTAKSWIETVDSVGAAVDDIMERFERGDLDLAILVVVFLVTCFLLRRHVAALLCGVTPPPSGMSSPREGSQSPKASDSEGAGEASSKARQAEMMAKVASRLEKLENSINKINTSDHGEKAETKNHAGIEGGADRDGVDYAKMQLGAERMLAHLNRQMEVNDDDGAPRKNAQAGRGGRRDRDGDSIRADVGFEGQCDRDLQDEIARLRRDLSDPREQVLKVLREYKKNLPWEVDLKGNVQIRVAHTVLPQLFAGGRGAIANVIRWAKAKGILPHPAIQNLLVICRAIEAMVMGAAGADRGMIDSRGVEILLRRVWGTQKAFVA